MYSVRYLATLLFLSACSESQPRNARAASGDVGLVVQSLSPDSVLRLLEERILALGHTRAALSRSLGTAAVQRVEAAEGPDGDLDTLISLEYPGLVIDLRKAGRDQREYFSNVRIVDTAFALPAGLRLFVTTAGEISQRLGTPLRTYARGDTTALSYESSTGLVVQFYMVARVLVRVRLVYELG